MAANRAVGQFQTAPVRAIESRLARRANADVDGSSSQLLQPAPSHWRYHVCISIHIPDFAHAHTVQESALPCGHPKIGNSVDAGVHARILWKADGSGSSDRRWTPWYSSLAHTLPPR